MAPVLLKAWSGLAQPILAQPWWPEGTGTSPLSISPCSGTPRLALLPSLHLLRAWNGHRHQKPSFNHTDQGTALFLQLRLGAGHKSQQTRPGRVHGEKKGIQEQELLKTTIRGERGQQSDSKQLREDGAGLRDTGTPSLCGARRHLPAQGTAGTGILCHPCLGINPTAHRKKGWQGSQGPVPQFQCASFVSHTPAWLGKGPSWDLILFSQRWNGLGSKGFKI